MAEKVEFETIKSTDIDFGTRNFLEIAKKKAITPDGENVFMSISRGFYGREDDAKKFRASIAFPADKKVVDKVIKAIKEAFEA